MPTSIVELEPSTPVPHGRAVHSTEHDRGSEPTWVQFLIVRIFQVIGESGVSLTPINNGSGSGSGFQWIVCFDPERLRGLSGALLNCRVLQ